MSYTFNWDFLVVYINAIKPIFLSYIAGELQEEGQEKYSSFIDELNHRIVGVSTNGDDKKGIILAIGK